MLPLELRSNSIHQNTIRFFHTNPPTGSAAPTQDHNCVRELRTVIHSLQQKMGEMKNEISDQNLTINELKRELQLFKDFMRAMRVSNPAMRAIADQMERDEVARWSNTLARARVTRWGGMISTPDDALQVGYSVVLLNIDSINPIHSR